MGVIKHGDYGKRLYRCYFAIKQRTTNKNCKDYQWYGGKGIKLCAEWNEYQVFKKWALTNGYKDNLTIDRIDNNKNYSPKNCRWVLRRDQHENRSNTIIITYKGKTKPLIEWAKQFGLSISILGYRVKHWPLEKAFTSPKYKNRYW